MIGGIVMFGLSLSILRAKGFSNEARANTAFGGTERDNNSRYDKLGFPEFEFMEFVYRSKNSENLLTLTHFQRVLDLHDYLMAYNNGQLLNTDCFKIIGLCTGAYHVRDYFMDATGANVFPGVLTTDAALLAVVNGGRNINLGSSVTAGNIFGTTNP